MDNRIVKICLICLSFIVMYFIIDVNDVLECIGLTAEKVNFDIADIVISNVVIVGLFLVTYHLIDSKEIERKRNQRQTAIVMLLTTYQNCIDGIKGLDNPFTFRGILSKCDFNAIMPENKILNYLQGQPFENNNFILEVASQGIITKDELQTYLVVKDSFKKYVLWKIAFYDNPNVYIGEHDKLLAELERTIKSLKEV